MEKLNLVEQISLVSVPLLSPISHSIAFFCQNREPYFYTSQIVQILTRHRLFVGSRGLNVFELVTVQTEMK
jgi:hypothetical protein